MRKSLLSVVCLVWLAGCVVGPDYERPDIALPQEWPEEVVDSEAPPGTENEGFWWRRYGDPVLDGLVRRALTRNLDIGIALAQLKEARAVLGLSLAEQYPLLEGTIEAGRGDDGLISSGGAASRYRLAGLLSYELDLWGRLARESEAARAELLASAFSRDAVQLAVVTEVVTTYFEYRALREQIAIIEDTIASQREALELERSRYRIGATTELTLRQAQAELETRRALLPEFQAEAAQRRRALAVLVGDGAATLDGLENLGDGDLPEIAPVLDEPPDFLPSHLLERRPDIRAAEAFLVAANADIGAARARWLPRLDLSVALGLSAPTPGDLFDGSATLWELGGTALAPLLDFGRRAAEIDGAEARRQIAELQYREVIWRAFQEVGDAWTQLVTALERLRGREREVEARLAVVDLAVRRYAGGLSPYLEVLDARRALFEAQLSRSEAARDHLIAATNLYRALGGGW